MQQSEWYYIYLQASFIVLQKCIPTIKYRPEHAVMHENDILGYIALQSTHAQYSYRSNYGKNVFMTILYAKLHKHDIVLHY